MMELYPLPVEGFKLLSAEASNDQITELVGMPFDIFTNTVLFVQRTRGRTVTDFLDQDDAGQKKIFSTLFNLSCYEDALQLVKPDAKALASELLRLQAAQREAEIRLVSERATLESLLRKQTEHDSQQVQEVTTRQQAVAALQQELDAADDTSLGQQIAALQVAIKESEAHLTILRQAEQAARVALTRHTTTLEAKRAQLAESAPVVDLKPPESVPAPDAERKTLFSQAIAKRQQAIAELDAARKAYGQRKAELTQQMVAAQKALLTSRQRQAQTDETRTTLVAKIESITVCPTCKQDFATPAAKETALQELAERLGALQDVDLAEVEAAYQQAMDLLTALPIPADGERTTLLDLQAADQAELAAIEATEQAFQQFQTKQAIYATQLQNAEKASRDWAARRSALTLEIQQLTDGLPTYELAVEQAVAAVEAAATQLKEAEAVRTTLENDRKPIQDLQRRLTEERTALTNATNRVFPDADWLQRSAATVKQLESVTADQAAQQQDVAGRAAVAEALMEAFGKEGIIACLFQEYIPDIQRLANEYLLALTNGELQITFSAERELKKKVDGVQATRSQFDIQVSKRNGGADYDLISGSEQNKAALVVNWALADLAYHHSNVSCNVRVFDEVFESLDAKSTERLVALLLRHAQSSGQVNLVITHSVELEDAFPAKIILRKENGASRLVA